MNELSSTIKPHITNQALTTLDDANSIAALYKNDYKIENDNMYSESGDHLKQISKSIRSVDTSRKSITDPMLAAQKAIKAHFDLFANSLSDKKSIISFARLKYEAKIEAERKAEEEAAKKVIELVRLKLQSEQKKAAEEQARLEEEAEAAAAEGDNDAAENILNQALESEQEVKEIVEEIKDEPVFIPPVSIATKTTGVSTRKTWQVEVVSKMALITAVGKGEVSLNALEVNEKFLRQRAVADGESYNIPGTVAYQKKIVAA